jgi:hypothetical protein
VCRIGAAGHWTLLSTNAFTWQVTTERAVGRAVDFYKLSKFDVSAEGALK